jgi:hypothetical protein
MAYIHPIISCIGTRHTAEALSKFAGKERVVAKAGSDSNLAERLLFFKRYTVMKQARGVIETK